MKYHVRLTAWTEFDIEADNKEEAIDLACNEIPCDWQADDEDIILEESKE